MGNYRTVLARSQKDGTPAHLPERVGAMAMLPHPLANFRSLRKIWADSGYKGPDFAKWVGQHYPRTGVEIIKRPDSVADFQLLPGGGWWSAPLLGWQSATV